LVLFRICVTPTLPPGQLPVEKAVSTVSFTIPGLIKVESVTGCLVISTLSSWYLRSLTSLFSAAL